MTRRALLAGAAMLAGAPRAFASNGQRIEIEGNRLVYRGRTLRLTGVAVGDPTYVRQPRPASDYAVIAHDWRANCIRIGVLPGHWRMHRQAVGEALASEVAVARSLGLFVIIDWHVIGFPGHYEEHVPADWGLPPATFASSLDEAAEFWREMAATYGDDPAVLFELWNEPVADGRHWKADGRHWPLFKAAWEDLVAVIRERSDTVVLCAGGYWAHDLVGVRDDLIDDPRVAYAWHVYPNADRADPSGRLRSLGGLHEVKPVVVTEWGFCTECARDFQGTVEDFAEPLMSQIIEPFGLSHTAWCYSVGAMPNLLATHDGTPSESGRFVRAALRRSATRAEWMLST